MSMNKTILLTGSNGFIGKNIKESFLSERYRLLTPSSKELMPSAPTPRDATRRRLTTISIVIRWMW